MLVIGIRFGGGWKDGSFFFFNFLENLVRVWRHVSGRQPGLEREAFTRAIFFLLGRESKKTGMRKFLGGGGLVCREHLGYR